MIKNTLTNFIRESEKLVSILTGLDSRFRTRKYVVYVYGCSKATASKPVTLETGWTVIHPPTVSVL